MRIAIALFFLFSFASLLGCGGEARREASALERERFIETNVALRQLQLDTAEVDSLRHEVLAEHGVTEEELRAFVLARADRPAELSAIWEEIHLRMIERQADEAALEDEDSLEEPAEEESVVAPPAGPLRLPDDADSDTLQDLHWNVPMRYQIQRARDTVP